MSTQKVLKKLDLDVRRADIKITMKDGYTHNLVKTGSWRWRLLSSEEEPWRITAGAYVDSWREDDSNFLLIGTDGEFWVNKADVTSIEVEYSPYILHLECRRVGWFGWEWFEVI
jgi:hypothetical protein